MKYLLIFLSVIALSCKSDKVVDAPVVIDDLIGNWELFYASRNGKVTKTTENAYILFEDDKTVKSNLFDVEKSHTFNFDGNRVKVSGDPSFKEFVVKRIQNDTLMLSSTIKSFKMEFALVKK